MTTIAKQGHHGHVNAPQDPKASAERRATEASARAERLKSRIADCQQRVTRAKAGVEASSKARREAVIGDDPRALEASEKALRDAIAEKAAAEVDAIILEEELPKAQEDALRARADALDAEANAFDPRIETARAAVKRAWDAYHARLAEAQELEGAQQTKIHARNALITEADQVAAQARLVLAAKAQAKAEQQ